MADDPFVTAVDQVAEAGRAASRSLEAALRVLERSREARLGGAGLAETLDALIAAGGRESRLAVAATFHEYERAVLAMRAGLVRALVDREGMSLTGVAQHMKISRQAAARLYRYGHE